MRQANRRKYHYIYRTTCTVTGKYYIGMHSTDNLEDGYVGSGKRLWYSINKHGKENHVCEILEHYFTREWLREREAELVNEELMNDPLCMNLKVGGEGGFDHINANGLRSPDTPSKGGRAVWEVYRLDPDKFERFRSSVSDNMSKLHVEGKVRGTSDAGIRSKGLLASLTDEAKEKRKSTYSAIRHQQGDKNSQFGSCWIHSLTEQLSKKVLKSELAKYLTDGWIVGRKMKF